MITLTAPAPEPPSRFAPSDRPGIGVEPVLLGDEGKASFYGSSFISDPYGRIQVQAPRDEEAVLVADLDLDQLRDWLELFPFPLTRRPDTYAGHAATAVVK